MELHELEEKVRSVLETEESDQCVGQTFYRSKAKGENKRFNYPNAETLIALFETIKDNNNLRSFFLKLLMESIESSIEYPVVDEKTNYIGYTNVSTLSFYVLLNVGYTNDALHALTKRFERSTLTYYLIYHMLDSNVFDNSDMKRILDKLENEQKPPENIGVKLKRKLLKKLGF